jgi:CBS domain-containing protein
MRISMVLTTLSIQTQAAPRELAMLSPSAKIRDATSIMAQRNVGMILVCDTNGGLVGVLSERDIIRGLAEAQSTALELEVSELMTANPATCTPQDLAKDVIRRMRDGRFRHMPVVEDGIAVGMVSTSDVLRFLAERLSETERDELWSISFNI